MLALPATVVAEMPLGLLMLLAEVLEVQVKLDQLGEDLCLLGVVPVRIFGQLVDQNLQLSLTKIVLLLLGEPFQGIKSFQ